MADGGGGWGCWNAGTFQSGQQFFITAFLQIIKKKKQKNQFIPNKNPHVYSATQWSFNGITGWKNVDGR